MKSIKTAPATNHCEGCYFKSKSPTDKRKCEKPFTLHAKKSCVNPASVIFVRDEE